MFKQLTLYRISGLELNASDIEPALAKMPFTPCAPTEESRSGWIPPRGHEHGALLEVVGGQWIMKIQTETKRLPAEVVGRRVDEMARQVEDQTGRKPSKKQRRQLREDAILALLPSAFPRRTVTPVWIDTDRMLLAIGTSSSERADHIATNLSWCVEGLQLKLLQTATLPASAMAGWLHAGEAPAGFSVGRECELKSTDEMKSVVRYGRHPLDTDEVRRHIEHGKEVTRLELDFKGRISFTVTDTLRLRGIELADVVMESHRGGADDHFDADVAIATGELGPAIDALIESMGGVIAELAAETAAAEAQGDDGTDPLQEQARAIVVAHRRVSISLVQRHLQIGYNRAARLIKSLEAMGVVGPMDVRGNMEVIAA